MAGKYRLDLDANRVRSAAMDPAVTLVRKVSRKVHDGAIRRVGVASGKTRASIYVNVSTTPYTATGKVGATSRVALIEHDGAKPHVIRPSRARALRFYWKRVGRNVILAKVNHPGREGSFFLTRPLTVQGVKYGMKVTLFP